MQNNHLILGTCDQCNTDAMKLTKDRSDGLYRCLSCGKIHERKSYAGAMEKEREKATRFFRDVTQ